MKNMARAHAVVENSHCIIHRRRSLASVSLGIQSLRSLAGWVSVPSQVLYSREPATQIIIQSNYSKPLALSAMKN